MRVLSICDGGGVSEFYRTLTPYRMLAEAGYITLTQSSGYNPAIIDHLGDFDTVVFSRSDSAIHSLILMHAKAKGLLTVLDVDDNLFLLPPSIPHYRHWHELGTAKIKPRLWHFKQNIKTADVFTVSTEKLGAQLSYLRQDYIVMPNMVLMDDWSTIPSPEAHWKPDNERWVGWWGIYNHWDDWRDVAPYIEPVILERPDTKLFILGMPEAGHLFPRLREAVRRRRAEIRRHPRGTT